VNTAISAVADTGGVVSEDQTALSAHVGLASVRTLGRAAGGSFALNIVNTGAAVATTVLLARVMDLAAFGIYSWVVATVSLLTVPAVLGIDRLLIRDIAVYAGRAAFGHARGLLRRSAEMMLVTCAVIVAAVAMATWLSGNLASPTAVALAVGMVALPLLAFGRLAQSALMGVHQVVVAQVPDLLVRPLMLLVIVAVAAAGIAGRLDAPAAVALYTASVAAGLAVAAYFMRTRLARLLPPARLAFESHRWVGAAFALALLSGGAVANSQIGVTLLGVLDKPEAAGLYAVAQRGALLVAFPLMALNAALAPTAARLWSGGRVTELQRLVTLGTRTVLLASAPVALIFVLLGGQVLELVFGAGFVAAAGALALLSSGQLVNSATGSVATLLIMTGNTWRAGLGILAGLTLNVVLGVVLIPAYHEAGAAIAAASSLVVANLIHVIMARRFLGIDTTPVGLPPAQAVGA
jgi:O-antigen/teichoic acid export membrane protein